MSSTTREGSLDAPTRHPIDWQNKDFYNEDSLFTELERIYDICHGCRRCVNLCNAFPSLFDLIDASETFELDGVRKEDYWKVVEDCYLCDLCYMTKCPYVPPHEWNVDFPHLMVRAKAQRYKAGKMPLRDRVLTNTDQVGKWLGIPIVAQVTNAVNQNSLMRKLLHHSVGIHAKAPVPKFAAKSARKQIQAVRKDAQPEPVATQKTTGKVALFITCYDNHHAPQQVLDLIRVLEHNGLRVELLAQEQCCGMPKLELGDLSSVQRLQEYNLPVMAQAVADGFDLLAPIPSCVLMFKQELPLLFPAVPAAQQVSRAMFDPFEYLMLRHKENLLQLAFKKSLGKVLYHVPCHQRVQNIGPKTKELLELIPDTHITVAERCSGHDGIYAIKREKHAIADKICRPIVRQLQHEKFDHYISDCPMAGEHIAHGAADGSRAESPFTLLCEAYQI